MGSSSKCKRCHKRIIWLATRDKGWEAVVPEARGGGYAVGIYDPELHISHRTVCQTSAAAGGAGAQVDTVEAFLAENYGSICYLASELEMLCGQESRRKLLAAAALLTCRLAQALGMTADQLRGYMRWAWEKRE